MTVHRVITALLSPREPIDHAMWRTLWDELESGRLQQGEAVALLTALAAEPPGTATTMTLLGSLHERRPATSIRYPRTVNIVGTGGGPRTFNISTAAAFVAAAAGLRVVKTGAPGYRSRLGSFDLLARLGIPLAMSYAEVGELLDEFGLAFAGYFVYPPELATLAREIMPLRMRDIGHAINALGPFLAAVPVTAQLTGVSDHRRLPTMRHLAAAAPHRLWLCSNGLGVDELTGLADDLIHPDDGGPPIPLADVVTGPPSGSLADLRPPGPGTGVVADFQEILQGRRSPQATRVICLNAAAMRIVLEPGADWDGAYRSAAEAVSTGAAVGLLRRMREAFSRQPLGGASR